MRRTDSGEYMSVKSTVQNVVVIRPRPRARRGRWRRPVTSLRVRIFLAMVAGALMVLIAAGIAIMNRISDDFDERLAMQSYSAGRVALQFYRQREDQLSHTALVVAGMQSVRSAVTSPSSVPWTQMSADVRAEAQLGVNDQIFIYSQQGRLLYADNGSAGGPPPLSLIPILNMQATTGAGAESIHGQPVLVGGAAINGAGPGDSPIGAVAVRRHQCGRRSRP